MTRYLPEILKPQIEFNIDRRLQSGPQKVRIVAHGYSPEESGDTSLLEDQNTGFYEWNKLVNTTQHVTRGTHTTTVMDSYATNLDLAKMVVDLGNAMELNETVDLEPLPASHPKHPRKDAMWQTPRDPIRTANFLPDVQPEKTFGAGRAFLDRPNARGGD